MAQSVPLAMLLLAEAIGNNRWRRYGQDEGAVCRYMSADEAVYTEIKVKV
jgi:hypothetical protein